MMGYLRPGHELGIYSAASALALPITTLTYSITTVFIPHVSRLSDPVDLARFLKDNFKLTTLISLGLILVAIPAGPLLLGQLYGSEYSDATPVFRVLVLAFVTELLLLPPGLVLFSRNRLDVVATINASIVAITLVANSILIPVYGGMGAAMVVLAGKLIAGAALLFFGLSVLGRTPLRVRSGQ
jgi:O-antigen/teichoic acid export membrane protein